MKVVESVENLRSTLLSMMFEVERDVRRRQTRTAGGFSRRLALRCTLDHVERVIYADSDVVSDDCKDAISSHLTQLAKRLQVFASMSDNDLEFCQAYLTTFNQLKLFAQCITAASSDQQLARLRSTLQSNTQGQPSPTRQMNGFLQECQQCVNRETVVKRIRSRRRQTKKQKRRRRVQTKRPTSKRQRRQTLRQPHRPEPSVDTSTGIGVHTLKQALPHVADMLTVHCIVDEAESKGRGNEVDNDEPLQSKDLVQVHREALVGYRKMAQLLGKLCMCYFTLT